MDNDDIRLSQYVAVEENDEEFLIKSRDEVGRGKRFGMSGEVALDEQEAERFARWVFARQFKTE